MRWSTSWPGWAGRTATRKCSLARSLIHAFSLENVGKSAGVFNLEKLDWLNFQYLKARTPEQLAADLRPFMESRGIAMPGDDAWLARMALTLRERAKTLGELTDSRQLLPDRRHHDRREGRARSSSSRPRCRCSRCVTRWPRRDLATGTSRRSSALHSDPGGNRRWRSARSRSPFASRSPAAPSARASTRCSTSSAASARCAACAPRDRASRRRRTH